MTKDEIREQMRTRRRQVSTEDLRKAGRVISQSLLQLECFSRAWRFCSYLSIDNEIPTRYIIRTCFAAGREVCVPAWDAINHRYDLYAFDAGMQLVKGHKGIREPAVKIPLPPWDVDLFILPGLAFDLHGGRLGYGGGHYDRLLAQANVVCAKVAVGFDWQVQETDLPLTKHDVHVDWIITDKRTIDCRANRTITPAPNGLNHAPLTSA